MKKRKVGRSAKDGQFLSIKTAQKRKATSIIQTVAVGKRKKK